MLSARGGGTAAFRRLICGGNVGTSLIAVWGGFCEDSQIFCVDCCGFVGGYASRFVFAATV